MTIPPEVLARYSAVNSNAEQVAQRPFQQYTGQFVAPLNATQQAGIDATNQYSQTAQPYFGAATSALNQGVNTAGGYYNAATQGFGQAQNTGGLLAGASLGALANANAAAQPYNAQAGAYNTAGTQAVNPSDLNSDAINKYMSPYLNTVLGSTAALLNQNNQQQQGGQLGNAIRSGAFGGDRAGIAAANLEQQQNLANANIYSNIANQAYTNALGTAQQQQGVGLAAGQANRAALQQGANTALGIGNQVYGQGAGTAQQLAGLGQQLYGQQSGTAQNIEGLGQTIYNTGAGAAQNLAALGTGAQGAALQGAQAQLAAGLGAQQTAQAQDTALYNQFLQQQSYPFQVAQFLANIAEGTGALSGSTTTTNSVQNGIFSDKRLKHDIKKIGETFDKQPIYSFKYKGDPQTHIGLMAQEVEKKHPGAVGLAGGYKTVDYGDATDDAAKRGKFATGGLVLPANDGVRGYDIGGAVAGLGFDPGYLQQLMAAYHSMYSPMPSAGGLGAGSIVPPSQAPSAHLAVSQAPTNPQQPSAWETAGSMAKAGDAIGQFGDKLGAWHYGDAGNKAGLGAADDGAASPSADSLDSEAADLIKGLGGRDKFKVNEPWGLATGGVAGGQSEDDTPYLNQEGATLGIPDDRNTHQLLTAQNPTGSGGGSDPIGTVGKVAGAGLTVMKLLPMLGLSDKRLKENIKPVGKTFDGQTVYSYNFKGDHTTQMGLLAQEVEHKHPKAVGELGKFKTVDYAEATAKAAKRGKFADGGAADDDSTAEALRRAINPHGKFSSVGDEMRAGISDSGNGLAAAAAPSDTSGDDAPASDSSTSGDAAGGILAGSLAAAAPAVAAAKAMGDTPKSAGSVFSKMLKIESGGKQFRKDGSPVVSPKGAIGIAQIMPGTGPQAAKLAGLPWDLDRLKSDQAYNAALGEAYFNSLVKQFDGDPLKAAAAYNGGAGRVRKAVDKFGDNWVQGVPNETQKYVSMLGGVKRAAGGRTGYADGGSPTDDVLSAFDADPELKKRAAALELAKSVAAPEAVPTTDNSMATGAMPTVSMAAPEDLVPVGLGATTPVPTGKGVVDAPEDTAPVAAPTGLAAASPDTASATPSDGQPHRGLIGQITHGGFMRGLGHGDANSWIPLLSGLGALATTQTNNPLTALTAALGTGAQAAQKQREFGLEQQYVGNQTASTAANVAATKANAIQTLANASARSIGNAAEAAKYRLLLKSYLQSGILNAEDLKTLPAPAAMPDVTALTPNLANPYAPPPAAGAASAPTPIGAPQGEALIGQQTMAQTNPELASIKPTPAPQVQQTEAPYSQPVNPGDSVAHNFYANSPEFKLYSTLNSQADALAQSIRQQPPTSPLIQGMTQQMQALREQANAHYAKAQEQFASAAQPTIKAIQDGVHAEQEMLTDTYPKSSSYIHNALDALSKTNVQSDSSAWASAIGRFASVPGLEKFVPDAAKLMQGNIDKAAMNQNYATMFSLINPGVGARTQAIEAAQIGRFGGNHANSGPAAAYSWAVNQQALLDQAAARAKAHIAAAPSITNDAQWNEDWMRKHPFTDFAYGVTGRSPLPKGTTPAQMLDYFKPAANPDDAKRQAANGARYVRAGNKILQVVKTPKGGINFVEWTGG